MRTQFKAAIFCAVLGAGLLASMGQTKITRGWNIGYFSDGSAAAPSVTFASDLTKGLYSTGSNVGIAVGGVNVTTMTASGVTAPAAGAFTLTGRAQYASPADGVANLVNNANSLGVRMQFAGTPTVGTCGTSPSVTAGSLDTTGEVNVGTGGTATACGITFATTWSNAPKCMAAVTSATTTDARAIAVTTTTTTATFTAASAYTASSKVWWICVGPK